MPRKKLTKAAISFIIKKRNDWNVNYTFADIAKLLEADFGITITEQAVSKSYRKHKDDEKAQKLLVTAKKKNIIKDNSRNDNLEVVNTIEVSTDFDEDAGKNYNIDDFFKKE